MNYRVGQKVVCITNEGWPGESSIPGDPKKGSVGTITNMYITYYGCPVLELAEWPQPGGFINDKWYKPGWLAEDWRPIVKTDISIFTAILTSTKQKADA